MECNQQNLPGGITKEQIEGMMQSEAAQTLLARLQANGGTLLQQAVQAARNGDYARVSEICSPLLESTNASGIKQDGDRKRG